MSDMDYVQAVAAERSYPEGMCLTGLAMELDQERVDAMPDPELGDDR